MINLLELEGRIDGNVKNVSGTDSLDSDFVVNHKGHRFQVICDSRIAYGFADGDSVVITGHLRSAEGDVYIMATGIVLSAQLELGL